MPVDVQTIPPYQSSFSAYTNTIATAGISLYSGSHCGKNSGNGGGDDMQQRIRDLEKDVQLMKTDVAVIRSNYATKADVSEAKASIIIWVAGAVVLSQLIPTIPNILKVFFP